MDGAGGVADQRSDDQAGPLADREQPHGQVERQVVAVPVRELPPPDQADRFVAYANRGGFRPAG